MLILNKNVKDYYDWYCSVLGVDNSVTYDRRSYVMLNPSVSYGPGADFFCTTPKYSDHKKREIQHYWQSNSVAFRRHIKDLQGKSTSLKGLTKSNKEAKKRLEGNMLHFILEVGHTHYYIEVERYLDDNGAVHLDATIIDTKKNITNRYGGDCPLSIIPLYSKSRITFLDDVWKPSTGDLGYIIKNPILTQTYIPSLVQPEDMWRMIYDFLSSLKDKPIVDNRTNDEHIQSAGFDTKESFRPKIK